MNGTLGGPPKTPWHIWVVGILSLLWNSGGANDYIQVKMKVADYLQQGADMLGITVDQISAYYDGFPIWADIGWGMGVWGAVAGSLLILLRNRFAFHAFVISALGLLITTIYTMTTPMPMGDPEIAEAARTFQMVFSAAIWLGTLLLIYYTHRMRKAGVLR